MPLIAVRLDEMVEMATEELAAIGLPPRETTPSPPRLEAAS